jgi:hypothetical protein
MGDRLRSVVDQLDIRPDDRVLEIAKVRILRAFRRIGV